jgi:hypothetical protein
VSPYGTRSIGPRLREPVRRSKSLVARGHLRVSRIFNLQPVGAHAACMVATARELAHDALEVVRARDLDKIFPRAWMLVHRTAAASELTESVDAL